MSKLATPDAPANGKHRSNGEHPTGEPVGNGEHRATTAGGGELSPARLEQLRGHFADKPAHRIAQNAVCQQPVTEVALDRGVVTTTDHTFSHRVDQNGPVTNQKRSGRCWMFAGLNLFRVAAAQAMNLKGFEFSQNWTLFFDKLERANYFLEQVIDTADRDADDRTVAFLLERPLDDGGQWNMFVDVVDKYGLVPQAAMPETNSSSNTTLMNRMLLSKLREAAATLRACRGGAAAMRDLKDEAMVAVHRVLCIHLGTPPTEFDWQWHDESGAFRRDGRMTPRQFADKYVAIPYRDFVCLVNDPRQSSPYGRTFTVDRLGNVVGGRPVKYLNVPVEVMKDVARKTLMAGQPVWMGCDVGKMMQRKLGIWDARLYDFAALYDTGFSLTKAQRLQHHDALMTHAMLFTGVDVVEREGKEIARRWRVENSWGSDGGKSGYYVMNDNWFDEHMFEIAADPQYLPAEYAGAIDQDPIVLPAWDPMGALARG